MKRLLATCCVLALAILVGCQYSQTVPGAGGPGGQTAEETGELREIKQLLEQTGLTVSSLADEVERQAQRERAAQGPPEIVRDLQPALRVLGGAMQAANLKKSDETLAILGRLDTLVTALYADMPASQIITHCERALGYLQLSEPDLQEAALELALAYDVAASPELPKLRPSGVDALLQANAKAQVTAGRPEAAMSVIDTVLQRCASHWSLALMNDVRDGVKGAQDAVERGKWPVVQAELMEMHGALSNLAEEVRLQSYTIGAEAPATAESAQPPTSGGAAAPETSQPPTGAAPGAAMPVTPPSPPATTTAPPAATGEAVPPAPPAATSAQSPAETPAGSGWPFQRRGR